MVDVDTSVLKFPSQYSLVSSSFFLFLFFSILNLVLSLSFVLSPIFHVLLQHNGESDFLLDSGSGQFGSNQLVVLSLNNLT